VLFRALKTARANIFDMGRFDLKAWKELYNLRQLGQVMTKRYYLTVAYSNGHYFMKNREKDVDWRLKPNFPELIFHLDLLSEHYKFVEPVYLGLNPDEIKHLEEYLRRIDGLKEMRE